jgi:hypothetical protein
MSKSSRVVAAIAVSSIGLATASAATATATSDAQVKAAVTKAIAAASKARGADLTKAVAGIRTSLTAAVPTSPAGKTAKALALQALAKESAAATLQVKAEQANTRMQYPTATANTAAATKDVKAALALLHKAAALL